jgi:hypothetical protein
MCVKQTTGKTEWHLLPWREVEEVVQVMMHGNTKYAEESWKLVQDKEKPYFSAALRHIMAWMRGEKQDPESGRSHLAHAVCCLLILMWDDNNK